MTDNNGPIENKTPPNSGICTKCKETVLFCKCWRDNMEFLKERALGH